VRRTPGAGRAAGSQPSGDTNRFSQAPSVRTIPLLTSVDDVNQSPTAPVCLGLPSGNPVHSQPVGGSNLTSQVGDQDIHKRIAIGLRAWEFLGRRHQRHPQVGRHPADKNQKCSAAGPFAHASCVRRRVLGKPNARRAPVRGQRGRRIAACTHWRRRWRLTAARAARKTPNATPANQIDPKWLPARGGLPRIVAVPRYAHDIA
jgi:hypothetical protein